MKPLDDVWKDISSLPSSTTHHFQDFFPPSLQSPGVGDPSPPLPPPSTTMLSLSSSSNSGHENPCKRYKSNPQPQKFTSPPEYTEKFKRLMKNRESAARSRARKQARADELEHEVARLAEENAKLKRMQKDGCLGSTQLPKKAKLNRTKSAPF